MNVPEIIGCLVGVPLFICGLLWFTVKIDPPKSRPTHIRIIH